jgi:hypothetical protein
MSIITPADVLSVDLTAAALLAQGAMPLVAGDDCRFRFQIREAGVAKSLTGATAWWTMRNKVAGDSTFVRKSGVVITGDAGGLLQIEFDADQVAEDVEAGTGKGWLSVQFSDEDQAALLNFVGLIRPWDLRVKFPAALAVKTYGRGRIEVVRPHTTSLT